METTELGLFEVLRTTRAIRRLKTEPVPEELLRQLVEAAQWAPSGSNQQSSRWIIVREPERKQRLAELNRAAVDGYLAARRAAVADLAEAEARSQRRLLESLQWQAEHLQDAPALIVACIALARPPQERFVSRLGTGGSVWPGVQNVLLAARALGLGAALTTLALSERSSFKAALDIPDDIEPVCLIPVGYPQDRFGPGAAGLSKRSCAGITGRSPGPRPPSGHGRMRGVSIILRGDTEPGFSLTAGRRGANFE